MKFGLKVNKKDVLNMSLGLLALKVAPGILDKIFPNSTFNSGVTGNLLSGAAVVAVGAALKNPTIQTIGIAGALSEIVGDVAIDPLMAKMMPAGVPAATGRRIGNYTTLKDFPKKVVVNTNYHNAYN